MFDSGVIWLGEIRCRSLLEVKGQTLDRKKAASISASGYVFLRRRKDLCISARPLADLRQLASLRLILSHKTLKLKFLQ